MNQQPPRDQVFRIRVAQAITLALLVLVALAGHRMGMQAVPVPPAAITLY